MKKMILTAVAMIAAALCLGAAEPVTPKDNVKYVTQTFNVANFNALELSNTFDVTVTRSSKYSVKVTAPDEIMDYVIAKVDEGTLELYLKNLPQNLRRRYDDDGFDLKAEIAMPELRGLEMSGATKFRTSDTFDIGSREFDLDVSGASKVEGLSIKAGSIESDVSGASAVKMNGKFSKAELDISGASNSNFKIDADDLNLEISGACNFDLDGTFGSMIVEASGAVNASISGSAKTLNAEASGAAKLKASGLTAEKVNAATSGTAYCVVNATRQVVLSSTGVSSLRYKDNSGLDVEIEELSKTASIKKM